MSMITGKQTAPIYILDEHNEAFYVWHKARYEGYIDGSLDLFHIDAHDDMGRPESFRTSIYRPPGSPAGYLKHYENFAKYEIHNGNFIVPAVLTGLIKNIYFIYPKWRQFKPKRKKFNVASAFGEGKALKHSLKMDKNANPKLFKKALPDIKYYNYSMQEADSIPKNRKVILDIDLDYFACRDSILNHFSYELEITEEQFIKKEALLEDITLPFAGLDFNFLNKDERFFVQIAHKKGKDLSYLPSKEEIESEIDALITTLHTRNTKPAVVTIARSCISGYCPKDYVDFIETKLTQRLQTLINR